MTAVTGIRPRAASLRLPAPYSATVAGLLLCAGIPVVLAAATRSPAGGDLALGQLAVIVLSGARYTWILGCRDRRPFEMNFWLFTYVFLGLAAYTQVRRGVDPPTTPHVVHAYDDRASLIVLFGAVAVMAGSAIARRRSSAGSAGRDFAVRPVRSSRLSAFTVVTLLVTALYVDRVGLGSLVSDRSTLGMQRTDAFGSAMTATIVVAVVSMGLLVSFVAQVQRRRELADEGRPARLAPLITTGAIMFLCVNPVSSPRYVSGTVVLGTLAALGLFATARRYRVTAWLAVAAFVFVFPVADAFRRSLTTPDLSGTNPLQALTDSDFDSYAQLVNTAAFVAARGITWGEQALGTLLFWVPRSSWPGKPVDTGILLAQYQGYGFENLSAPLYAEMFINGGWLVLVLGMGVLGWLLRRLDDKAEVSLRTLGYTSIVATVAPFYMLIMLRGSLLQSMSSLVVLLGSAWFVTGSTRRSSSGPSPATQNRSSGT